MEEKKLPSFTPLEILLAVSIIHIIALYLHDFLISINYFNNNHNTIPYIFRS